MEGCTRKVTCLSTIVALGSSTSEIIVDDGVSSSSSWSKSICYIKTCLMRISGPMKTTASFQR